MKIRQAFSHCIVALTLLSLLAACAGPAVNPTPSQPVQPPPPSQPAVGQPPSLRPTPLKPQPPDPTSTPDRAPIPAAPTPAAAAGALPTLHPNPTLHRPQSLQIGLNFIRFYWSDRFDTLDLTTPYLQPPAIFDDFAALNVHAYRQFVNADLFWDVVEPQDDQWNFAQADAVITNPDFEPLVTLFRMQYASPTPPWASGPEQFQKTMGVEATDYLKTVVQRYAPYITYWEIGNEMAFWRAADPGGKAPDSADREEALPAAYPLDGYSPQEQGVFLAQAAAIIRQYDPDAVIVMPGVPALDGYAVETWLPGVLETAGSDWFDIVNYHDYADWEIFTITRPRFQQAIEKLGIGDKPVWNTETGSSSSANLTLRTDYPNSVETQAADVFRRIVQAWGHGDALVVWHTYINNSDNHGDWAAYGIRSQSSALQPSYFAFKLLTDELTPFELVEKLAADGRGVNAYRVVTQAGAEKFVAWGKGDFKVPAGVTQMTSVIPAADGSFGWQSVQPGQMLALTVYPILLK